MASILCVQRLTFIALEDSATTWLPRFSCMNCNRTVVANWAVLFMWCFSNENYYSSKLRSSESSQLLFMIQFIWCFQRQVTGLWAIMLVNEIDQCKYDPSWTSLEEGGRNCWTWVYFTIPMKSHFGILIILTNSSSKWKSDVPHEERFLRKACFWNNVKKTFCQMSLKLGCIPVNQVVSRMMFILLVERV